MIRLAAAVLFVAGWAATASAQSLADVARKEEARRKHVAKPARVLTNKDLKPSEIPIPPAGSDQAAPAGDAKPRRAEAG